MTTVSLVVSYYDDVKRPLVAAALLPRARQVQGDHPDTRVWLERHWLRGPHVRLSVEAEDVGDDGLDELVTEPANDIRGWIAANPSRTSLDPGTYAARSDALGRAELVGGPYLPLRPDNTVSIEPHPGEPELIGPGADLKHDVLSRAMTPLAAMLPIEPERLPTRGATLLELARVLVLHADRWPRGGAVKGHLTYRSHVEEFLHVNDPDGRLRGVYDARLVADQDVLSEVVSGVLADSEAGRYTGADPVLSAWSAALDDLWPAAIAAARTGRIADQPGGAYLDAARRFGPAVQQQWTWGDDRTYSSFHQVLRSLNFLEERVAETEFAAYRFLTNQVYRLVPLLDVTPLERYYLCYALADTLERHFATTWRELLDVPRPAGAVR